MPGYEVDNIYKHHPPKPNQQDRYEDIRHVAKTFATMILDICPNSRERSVALTNLEQAVMWANASIARNE